MSSTSPLDVEDLRVRVRKHLDDFISIQVPRLDGVGEDLDVFTEALTDLMNGGKRLRPAFCYWGWRAAGGADTENAVKAATALELLQACALVHDDVMDGSDTRRGLPAAHRRFAALHRGNEWLGSPEDFGLGAALYDEMRTELMAGQYLDLLEQARGGGSIERAERVIRFKSAKYTIERPLHLGVLLAGGSPELLTTFTNYGLPLGEAFQLRDDVLGVFGDPSETGKPAGDDLREGKRTVLIAKALETASPSQASKIRRHLGDPHLDAEGVALLREILTETGALDAVEARISELTANAQAAIVDVTNPARDVLSDLITAATARAV